MKIELTTFLYDKRMKDDLGMATEDIPVKLTIDTESIDSVRERVEDDETEICKKSCIIYMESGESFQIGKSYDEMIEIWNSPH